MARFIPGALAQRIPLIIMLVCVATTLLSAWVTHSLHQRSTALTIAQNSGASLHALIRRAIDPGLVDQTQLTSGVYSMERHRGLNTPLPSQSVLLILQLEQDRLRSAVVFQEPPNLPDALRAGRSDQTASQRLSKLSHGMARQDIKARLVVFMPDGATLEITAPTIWKDRLSQPMVVLIGLFGFAVIISLALALSLKLTAPFQQLARRQTQDTVLDVLASTEAHTINHRLQYLTDQFRIEQDRKSRSLAAISHDLRTPVTRLRLRNELLEDEDLRVKFESDLDEVTSIVDGALNLLSIRSQPEETHNFSLVALLESLVNDYRDTGKPVTFHPCSHLDMQSPGSVFSPATEITIKSESACMMTGQPDKLRRAFSNLINNALKYGDTAAIEVLPLTKDMFHVSIQDNGPGIDPDQIDKVLLPFVRGRPQSAAPKPTDQGVGLGLSIALEIIEIHGGTINFTNTHPGLLVSATIARES
ncbi:sensor histidine kinase [Halocynthiibacter namhaensis]|uniref:sensor histidine kinase n=1 Tax=Halocynthiibacter namhaensis TaxID=1290553 RepID=UPI00138DD360|nr:HAMP domain-containing sensor histidine kinase [Halocynthiibacter namhaensis]